MQNNAEESGQIRYAISSDWITPSSSHEHGDREEVGELGGFTGAVEKATLCKKRAQIPQNAVTYGRKRDLNPTAGQNFPRTDRAE